MTASPAGDGDGAPEEGVRKALRAVHHPGLARDIVAAGYVRDIKVEGGAVRILFAPNTTDAEKVARMEHGMRDALYGADFFDVQIRTVRPFDDDSMLLGDGALNPLQAELLEAGVAPEPDTLRNSMRRADTAPETGYRESGPEAFVGPRGAATFTYDGQLPVLQWDIDPHDSAADSFETEVKVNDWDYRVWWQIHPAGDLAYVSLQAMRDDWADHIGEARTHPVGRSEAVNLVYDANRRAVVAIYGTIPDFRPFVEAFGLAWSAKTGAPPWTATRKEDS